MTNQLWELYGTERDNMSMLPDSDSDFIALEQAYKKLTQSVIDDESEAKDG